MSTPISDLSVLLREMTPVLNDGVYVYAVAPASADPARFPTIATFHEEEGITLIMREAEAIDAGLRILFRAAWITLKVHSDLHAVGLTAAFSSALSAAGIGCNVVAGAHHDHVFVPFEQAEAAMRQLAMLQARNADRSRPASIIS